MSSSTTDQSSVLPLENGASIASPVPSFWRRRGQWQHLGIVLLVTLSAPISGSMYSLLGGKTPTEPLQQDFRLVSGLIRHATALVLLWYVMCRQGKTWKDIGWKVEVTDIPRALGLLLLAYLLPEFALIPLQSAFRAYSGHFLAAKSLTSVFGFGISSLSIVFVLLNPFFEEMIVRAYTMTEIINLGGSSWMAIVVSVVAQMSYHLYQGLVNAIALTIIFTIFSIYFVQTRKIVPVVLAHLCLDMIALLGGRF
jgi:membrane protease YdiL (CAAX protease family)